VLVPNPFYQAYGAAALAAGAELVPVPATAATGFLPDYAALPPALLDRVTLCYICSPSNPQGAVASEAYLRDLLALAERHDFRVLADECYSEIYRDAPPPGALAAAAAAGADPERVMVFQSLSKRSSAPGLRCGFAAGGPASIAALRRLRAYGGAPVPLPLQHAATALWRDEAHVAASRALYVEKFELADAILGDLPGYVPPRAGFFLWLPVGNGEAAALTLYRETGVRVLPGAYLGRADAAGRNPGAEYIRVALVAEATEVARGLGAIREVLGEIHTTERAG
jgi:aspartate/methionine/tyrosine aminotransferase